MKLKEERNLIVSIIEFAKDKESFTMHELHEGIGVKSYEVIFIGETLTCNNTKESNPNHIIGISELGSGVGQLPERAPKYRLLTSAYFSYVDHIEIIEARKNAIDAKQSAGEANKLALNSVRLSRIAIYITLALGLIDLCFNIFDKFFPSK